MDIAWRLGFGWFSVLTLIVLAVGSVIAIGATRLFLVLLAVVWLILLVYRYYQWNGAPWRVVHFRAMRVYARLAGEEVALSRMEGRKFDKAGVCRQMALLVCEADRASSVDAMIAALQEEKGGYFAGVLRKNASLILPTLTIDEIQELALRVNGLDFGPFLVIGNIIENTFGQEEAARYVLAIMRRAAF